MFECASCCEIQTRQSTTELPFSCLVSKLEHAAIVWDSCTQELSDLIENVQYRAGKIVSGKIHRTSKELDG